MAIINNKNLLQTAKTAATAKATTTVNVTTIVSNFQTGKISLAEFKNQLTKAGIKYTTTSTTINFTYNGKKYVINSKSAAGATRTTASSTASSTPGSVSIIQFIFFSCFIKILRVTSILNYNVFYN